MFHGKSFEKLFLNSKFFPTLLPWKVIDLEEQWTVIVLQCENEMPIINTSLQWSHSKITRESIISGIELFLFCVFDLKKSTVLTSELLHTWKPLAYQSSNLMHQNTSTRSRPYKVTDSDLHHLKFFSSKWPVFAGYFGDKNKNKTKKSRKLELSMYTVRHHKKKRLTRATSWCMQPSASCVTVSVCAPYKLDEWIRCVLITNSNY